jgi:hypothetical protein
MLIVYFVIHMSAEQNLDQFILIQRESTVVIALSV